jgi:type II secretory pathway pseudopilin PulG
VKAQRGLSLLEVLLVMVLSMVLLLGFLQVFRQWQRPRQVRLLKQSIDQVLHAGLVYAAMKPAPMRLQPLTVAELKQSGALPTQAVINNPWGQKFLVEIIPATKTLPARVQVRAKMNRLPGGTHSQDFFCGLLGAKCSGDLFMWQALRQMPLATFDDPYWPSSGRRIFFKKTMTIKP